MADRKSKDDTQENKPPAPEIVRLVSSGDVNAIRNLLLKGKAKVNETDSSGMTALHHAAYKGNADLTKMLIAHVSLDLQFILHIQSKIQHEITTIHPYIAWHLIPRMS